MAAKVKWTRRAKVHLELLVKFLTEKWSYKVALAAVEKIYDSINILAKYPEMGAKEEANDIRSIVIDSRLRLFYRIKNEAIIILGLIDTREEPGKFKPY